jgi:hypothetical protein
VYTAYKRHFISPLRWPQAPAQPHFGPPLPITILSSTSCGATGFFFEKPFEKPAHRLVRTVSANYAA